MPEPISVKAGFAQAGRKAEWKEASLFLKRLHAHVMLNSMQSDICQRVQDCNQTALCRSACTGSHQQLETQLRAADTTETILLVAYVQAFVNTYGLDIEQWAMLPVRFDSPTGSNSALISCLVLQAHWDAAFLLCFFAGALDHRSS